jgi:hypothetical protein
MKSQKKRSVLLFLLCLGLPNIAQATPFFVSYNDFKGPRWEGIVDTGKDILTINSWVENSGLTEFWTPHVSNFPIILNATDKDLNPFDVPENWNGTTGDNWGFISPISNFEFAWNEGIPTSFFEEVFWGWGGTFQGGNFFQSPFDPSGTRLYSIQRSETTAESSEPEQLVVTPVSEPSVIVLIIVGLPFLLIKRSKAKLKAPVWLHRLCCRISAGYLESRRVARYGDRAWQYIS